MTYPVKTTVDAISMRRDNYSFQDTKSEVYFLFYFFFFFAFSIPQIYTCTFVLCFLETRTLCFFYVYCLSMKTTSPLVYFSKMELQNPQLIYCMKKMVNNH